MEGACYPEPTPVQLVAALPADAAGKAAPPPAFEYVARMPLPPNAIDPHGGCSCKGPCGDDCSCVAAHRIGMTALMEPDAPNAVLALLECGPACACACKDAAAASGCGARLTQGGVRQRLAVVPCPGKGWGVRTLEPLQRGVFVCGYSGEYLNTRDARARLASYDAAGGGHALLVVRVILPSAASALRLNIDATARGNVARFINHACDGGNLEAVLVMAKGELLPRVALFAARDVEAGEELTFSYCGRGPPPPPRPAPAPPAPHLAAGGGEGAPGGDRSGGGGGAGGAGGAGGGGNGRAGKAVFTKCLCGTAACYGYLPSEFV